MSRKKQIVGSAARDSVMISRNGQFGAAIALILRLQAIATAVLKALAGLPLNPAN
jgi:aspartate aminotransferase-like enzyme